MQVKMGAVLLVSLIVLAALPLAFAQSSEASCTDGTAQWTCSTTQPGYMCLPDANGDGGATLQNIIGTSCPLASSTCSYYQAQAKCECATYPGYALSSDGTSCVKTTCTDSNGQTVQNGLCGATKPQQCSNGQMVPNPTACGCPSGQQMSPDGKTCVTSSGCRWNNPTCPQGEECDYVSTVATDPGVCKPKPGCNGGTVTCPSYDTCDTSTVADGVCKLKPGACETNIDCQKGQVCVNNACQAGASGSSGSTDTVLGTGSSPTPSSSSASSSASNPLSCCCLPGAGATGLVGLALLRRKDENED